MNVLICSGIFPPEVGGPATYSKVLAEELTKLGDQVRVITYSDGNLNPPLADATQKNVAEGFSLPVTRITRSRRKPWHYFKYFLAVLWHGRRADILYVQDPVSSGLPVFLGSRILRKPFLVKVTGDYSWEQAVNRGYTSLLIDEFQYLQEFPEDIKNIREAQIRVCKAADGVIVPAEYLARLVRGWAVKPRNVKVIYNAAPSIPQMDRHSARKELEISKEIFLIVSAGRNVPWKGFALVRRVATKMEEQDHTVRLEIIHDAPHDLLMKWLAAADVFILNTAYEGAPHIVLEAMQLGTPVVTTKVGGNPEFIHHGQSGLLIEYNNEGQLTSVLQQLRDNPQLRSRLAAKAREEVGKFSLENMINQTEGVLQNHARAND